MKTDTASITAQAWRIWRSKDNKRKITVYADRKVREGYYDNDQWPTLTRPEGMTDEAWLRIPDDFAEEKVYNQ